MNGSTIGFAGWSAEQEMRCNGVETLRPMRILRLPIDDVSDQHDSALLARFADDCDVVFVELPAHATGSALQTIIRTGTPLLAAMPGGMSQHELRHLCRLAEESKSIAAVSRPLRFLPTVEGIRENDQKVELIWGEFVRTADQPRSGHIAEIVDLVVLLIGSRGIQRLDAKSIVEDDRAETLVLSIRFQNTGLAVMRFRVCDGEPENSTLNISGSWGTVNLFEGVRPQLPELIVAEARAFAGRTISDLRVARGEESIVFDGFRFHVGRPAALEEAQDTARVVEQIMERLRQHDSLAI